MDGRKSKVIDMSLSYKVVSAVVALLIIILNSIEIHTLRRTRNKPFYEKILLSLTVCDLMGGIYASSTVPFTTLVDSRFHKLYWTVWSFVVCYCAFNTIMHLIIIRH